MTEIAKTAGVKKKIMKLIDAQPIVKFIMDGLNNPDKMKALGHDAIEILAEIEYAPTIDAVEVVRCKDCKNYFYSSVSMGMRCRLDGTEWGKDDFCSCGERNTENDTKCVDSITPQTKKALEMMGKTAHGEIDFDYGAEN